MLQLSEVIRETHALEKSHLVKSQHLPSHLTSIGQRNSHAIIDLCNSIGRIVLVSSLQEPGEI